MKEGREMGLRINQDKTKIVRYGKKFEPKNIRIGQYEFEEVDKFKYLGVLITSSGERRTEIEEKIIAVNRTYYANKKLLKSKILTKNTKMDIYKTIIRPVMMYAAETLTLTKREEEDLRIVERKVMRTILGPVRVSDNEYRPRMNHEIHQDLGGEDIVKKIKKQRVKWLGHVWRAGMAATTRAIMQWEPACRRRRGRPRLRWLQEVERDLEEAGVTRWKEKVGNRNLWRSVCEKV